MSQILQRIVKLMALSKSSNPHEAEVALAKANKLMFEHRIEMAEVVQERDQERRFTAVEVMQGMRIQRWKLHLAVVLSESNGCVFVTQEQESNGAKIGCFVGNGDVIQCTTAMFAHATSEIARLASQMCTGRGKSVFNAFSLGAVQGIHDRLEEQKKANEAGQTSAALAIVNSETDAINAFLDRLGCQKKKHKKQTVEESSYVAGYANGRAMGLGEDALPEGKR